MCICACVGLAVWVCLWDCGNVQRPKANVGNHPLSYSLRQAESPSQPHAPLLQSIHLWPACSADGEAGRTSQSTPCSLATVHPAYRPSLLCRWMPISAFWSWNCRPVACGCWSRNSGPHALTTEHLPSLRENFLILRYLKNTLHTDYPCYINKLPSKDFML